MAESADIKYIIDEVIKASDGKRNRSIADYFREGIFKFFIPGLIFFAGSFLAMQRSFEIFKTEVYYNFKVKDMELQVTKNTVEELKERAEKSEKDFQDFAREYYKTNPQSRNGGSVTSKNSTN